MDVTLRRENKQTERGHRLKDVALKITDSFLLLIYNVVANPVHAILRGGGGGGRHRTTKTVRES